MKIAPLCHRGATPGLGVIARQRRALAVVLRQIQSVAQGVEAMVEIVHHSSVALVPVYLGPQEVGMNCMRTSIEV